MKIGFGLGLSDYSAARLSVLSAPVATAATAVSGTSFVANWDTYDGADTYYLDVSISPTFSSFVLQQQPVLAPDTFYIVTGLTPCTTYYYRVRAEGDVPNSTVPPVLGSSGTQSTGTIIPLSNTGTWANQGATFQYRWTRNGIPILGQTSNSYTIQAIDDGTVIRCEVLNTNNFGSSTWTPTSNIVNAVNFQGLLDIYPNAAVAYSVRKLKAAYTGSAIKVRRSSDNAEQNIGFTALGDLDETSLTTFVGANNGFVVTWYDQSGNANDATQSTPSLQPQIVSAGAILTMNSKPCMTLDGNDDFLALTTQQSVNADFLHTFVAKRPSSGNRMYGLAGMNDYLLGLWSNDFYYLQGDTTGLLESNAPDSTNNRMLLTGINSASTKKIYKDGTEIPSTFFPVVQVLRLNYIGRYIFFYSPASLQEIIFYNSNQTSNRTGIEGNINTYYAIY